MYHFVNFSAHENTQQDFCRNTENSIISELLKTVNVRKMIRLVC